MSDLFGREAIFLAETIFFRRCCTSHEYDYIDFVVTLMAEMALLLVDASILRWWWAGKGGFPTSSNFLRLSGTHQLPQVKWPRQG